MDKSAFDGLGLLEIDLATLFVLSPGRRLARQNDPDSSPAPRLFLAGRRAGYLFAMREDVGDETAAAIASSIARAPPWRKPRALPPRLGRLIEILGREEEVRSVTPALIYRLPNGVAFEHEARIVADDTPTGDALAARLAEEGLPPALGALGFAGVHDFWSPWCAAMAGDQIASLAFAARLGPQGAEAGLVTVPEFRARGFAAAATAAWSRLPSLAGRALFYSTQTTNLSSQRVTARLGLRLIGGSVSLE